MVRGVQKKLELACAGEERPQLDVTAGGGDQDGLRLPLYLLQPKAKATEPPYLSPSETIIVKDQDGEWRRARLTKHTSDYRNYSYHWGYYVLPADEADLAAGDADEHWAYLHPGEDWGVLRGLDTCLDIARLDPEVPAGPQLPHILTTACEACNGGEVKVFEEEMTHLKQQLTAGFSCAHGRRITTIRPGASTEGPFLPTPRPGYPRLPASVPGPEATVLLAAASTVASTVSGPKIDARCREVRRQLTVVVHVHSDLAEAVTNCNMGEVSGYKDLEEEMMNNYLKPLEDGVEELEHRAEQIVLSLNRLADVAEDVELAEQEAAAREGQEATRKEQEVARQAQLARQEQEVAKRTQLARLEQEAAERAQLARKQQEAAERAQLARQQATRRQEEQVEARRQAAGRRDAQLARQDATRGLDTLNPYNSEYATGVHEESVLLGREQLPPPLSTSTSRSPLLQGGLPSGLPPPLLSPPAGASSAQELGTPRRRNTHADFYQQAVSPQSRQALKIQISRMNKDRAAIDQSIANNKKDGVTKFMASTVNTAITEAEKQIGDCLATLNQQLRAAAFSSTSRPALERDGLYDEWYEWLRAARDKNWATVKEAEVQGGGGGGAGYMERVKFPTFDGRPENWADFRRKFKELVRTAGYRPVLEMSILVDHLSEDAARYVLGVEEPAEAWERLEKRYGDRTLAIITARHRLLNLKIPKGPVHDQVEALVQGLMEARTRLKAVQAEAELFGDISTVGHLLSKLPHSVQQVWYRHRATFPTTCSATETGHMFEDWLKKEGDAAMHQRLTILSTELSRPPASVAPPQQPPQQQQPRRPDPPLRDQPAGRQAENFSITSKGRFDTKEQAEEAAASATARADPCPACQGSHTYDRNLGAFSLPWPTNKLEACAEFTKMTPDKRATMVEAQGGCCLCTATRHKAEACWMRNQRKGITTCSVMVGAKACGAHHHHLLHGSKSRYCQAMSTSSSQAQPSSQAPPLPGSGSLFSLLEVPVLSPCGAHESTALMLEDPGSTDNFVTHALARRLQLPSTPTSLFIRVLDQQYRERPTMVYFMNVVDMQGTTHRIEAIGMDSLTDVAPAPEVSTLATLFPSAPPAATAAFRRPHGVVQLLLGMRDRRLHCTDGLEYGDLRLCRTRFTPGWVLTGFSSTLTAPAPRFSSEVLLASLAAPPPARPVQSFFLDTRTGPQMGFMEAEELGTTPAAACSSCKGCKECGLRRRVLTSHEAEVVDRIEKEMERDPETGIISASYPWKPCATRMRNNRNQVEKIQKRIETSMCKDSTFQAYKAEMEKAFQSGAVRELTREETEEWSGPVHFLTLFPVHKEASVSTKLRIVSNSALVNALSGLSLNDCLWGGPNALAELLAVLVHWRTVDVALVTDITKAYHVIHTREKELHLRRFLWREAPTLPWRVCAHTRATFGDLPAGLMLELVKRRAATLGVEVDPMAAQQIMDDSYVDDIILGGSREEVQRMKGHLQEDGTYSGTVTRILGLCGMRPKFLAVSGDQDPAAAEALGGKVLGLGYNLGADTIMFKLELKYLEKVRGKKVEKRLTLAELEAIRRGAQPLSRRTALSLLQSWFDPLGLLAPALLQGKMLLRRLHNPSLGWDDEIPAAERMAWADWLGELAAAEEVTFPRSTTPPGHRGAPSLAAFADSSLSAYCAAVYVVWEAEGGAHSSRLLLSKCRLTALKGTTIPRGELCAVVVMLRLAVLAATHLATPIHRISLSTDSECVIAALSKSGSSFKPYWQNRVSEIAGLQQELSTRCEVLEPVTHVSSALNPADLGTRAGVTLADLGPSSLWQQGPVFLSTPRDQWPLQVLPTTRITVAASHSTTSQPASSTESAGMGPAMGQGPTMQRALLLERGMELRSRVQQIVLTCLSRWSLATCTRILARLLRALLTRERAAILASPSPRDVAAARQLLLLAASPSAFLALKSGRLLSLGAQEHRGLVVVTGRVGQAHLAKLLGTSSLPVVMPSELLAQRVTEEAHREDHRMSVRDISARVRRTTYIPGGNRLAKAVAGRCMVCRLSKRIQSKQIMGDLPAEKLSGAAPFIFTALDMFGPWKVRELAGGRRYFKCWGVMFCCLATKAVCILACPGYDTATFGIVYRRFTAIYGDPSKVFLDHGPQLVAYAGAQELSLDQVAEEAGRRGTEWVFSPKACSWRNGQAEVCIRLARHTLAHQLSSTASLDFHSLETTFLEVAAILNRRPIAVRYASADDWHAICASDILLGRAHWRRPDLAALPHLPQDLAARRAMDHQQEVVAAWWEQWLAQAFPEMIPRSAWKHKFRNVRVGDIGHLQYKSTMGKSAYRLCRITSVSPDTHGVVRTCAISFRPRHRAETGPQYRAKEPESMTIGVQRFAVLLPVELQEDEAFSLSPRRPSSPTQDSTPTSPLAAPLAAASTAPLHSEGPLAAPSTRPLSSETSEAPLAAPSTRPLSSETSEAPLAAPSARPLAAASTQLDPEHMRTPSVVGVYPRLGSSMYNHPGPPDSLATQEQSRGTCASSMAPSPSSTAPSPSSTAPSTRPLSSAVSEAPLAACTGPPTPAPLAATSLPAPSTPSAPSTTAAPTRSRRRQPGRKCKTGTTCE